MRHLFKESQPIRIEGGSKDCDVRFPELDWNAGLDSLDFTDAEPSVRPLVLRPGVGFGDAERRRLVYGGSRHGWFFGDGSLGKKEEEEEEETAGGAE